jgi:hypothetical protein
MRKRNSLIVAIFMLSLALFLLLSVFAWDNNAFAQTPEPTPQASPMTEVVTTPTPTAKSSDGAVKTNDGTVWFIDNPVRCQRPLATRFGIVCLDRKPEQSAPVKINKPVPQKTSNWSGEMFLETTVNSSYDGMDVGDEFYGGWVANQFVDVKATHKNGFYIGGNTWLQMPITNFKPSYAWEADFGVYVGKELPKDFGIEAGYSRFFVKGGWIDKYAFTASKELPMVNEFNLSIKNETAAFTTSKSLDFRGGVMNKTSYTLTKKFVNDVLTPSLTLAHSFDNDPFGEKSRFNMRGFISGEIDMATGENSSVFIGGSYYFGLLGHTERGKGGFISFGFRFSKLWK